jgi:hypothetical protein
MLQSIPEMLHFKDGRQKTEDGSKTEDQRLTNVVRKFRAAESKTIEINKNVEPVTSNHPSPRLRMAKPETSN